jgi:hypothetical protein
MFKTTKDESLFLDAIINIASAAYGNDDVVLEYYKKPKGNFGDTLAQFIVEELRETFEEDKTGTEQLHRAVQVMRCALLQVKDVVDALNKSLRKLERNVDK